MFGNLQAAFDSMDRKMLMEALKGKEIRRRLIERVEEILREINNKMRVREEVGESFWTGRRVWQECPLNPSLFNILIANLEQEMRKWEGLRLGEKRIYSPAYADNVVLVAEDEDKMMCMMKRLEKYVEGKRLELNTEKTKTVRFTKRDGKIRKRYDDRREK